MIKTGIQDEIIKIQPRGVLTIPKRFRSGNFGENNFLRVKKIGSRLVFEPVTMLGYPVRRYTDSEVEEFLKQDEEEIKSLV